MTALLGLFSRFFLSLKHVYVFVINQLITTGLIANVSLGNIWAINVILFAFAERRTYSISHKLTSLLNL